MKYYARIGPREFEIRIEQDVVYVDDEPFEVDLHQSGVPELYSLLLNGASYELLMEIARFNYGVTLRGERFDVQIEDERTRRLNAGRKMAALPEGELKVLAPIPGLVIKVLVEAGDEIHEGQALVLLEAMKMENEIRALRGGVVHRIEVAPGQRVEQNGVLLILE
jgi:biotin carboxyl carrier protein